MQIRAAEHLTFIQIGANDGVRWDPLRELVTQHGLRGVLVEPLPDFFAELTANYAGVEGLAFECAAIDAHTGTRTLYRVRRDAPVPDWAHGLGSLDESHLAKSVSKEYIEAVPVATITMRDLLKKHDIQAVSLLQVDAEGFDAEVIKFAFQGGLLPKIINFENVHLSPEGRVSLKRLLIQKSYRFVDYGDDTIAILDP